MDAPDRHQQPQATTAVNVERGVPYPPPKPAHMHGPRMLVGSRAVQPLSNIVSFVDPCFGNWCVACLCLALHSDVSQKPAVDHVRCRSCSCLCCVRVQRNCRVFVFLLQIRVQQNCMGEYCRTGYSHLQQKKIARRTMTCALGVPGTVRNVEWYPQRPTSSKRKAKGATRFLSLLKSLPKYGHFSGVTPPPRTSSMNLITPC